MGPRDGLPQTGPALALLSTYPAAGEGVDCSPASPSDCGVPVDAPIELRFSRFLMPSTAVRQSILASTGDNGLFLSATYDPVERVVVYRLPGGGSWLPGVRYRIEAVQPRESPEGWGFRAFDGAELSDAGPAPLVFDFRVRRDPARTALAVPTPPTYAEASDIFARGGCTSGGCHGSPAASCPAGIPGAGDSPCAAPRMGLALDSPDALAQTALGQVAHQTETDAVAAEPRVAAARLGVAMPLISPASPGNSYLLYKVMVNDRWSGPACLTRYSAPVAEDCPRALGDELERLRCWFVRGAPMPLDVSGPGPRLEDADLRTLADWIAAGAPLE